HLGDARQPLHAGLPLARHHADHARAAADRRRAARRDRSQAAPMTGKRDAETILRVEHLSVVFRTYAGVVQAVRDVSLSLTNGEILAIVGESGSGKSVTAQAIMGLTPIPPGEIRGGSVVYDGVDMVRATSGDLARIRGAGISMIFQDPMTSLNPSMQIGAQIREVLHQHRTMSRAESRVQAIELLRLVGIPAAESRLAQYPHQFSGGMRQRIMIAIAIANNPDILIADEPTT